MAAGAAAKGGWLAKGAAGGGVAWAQQATNALAQGFVHDSTFFTGAAWVMNRIQFVFWLPIGIFIRQFFRRRRRGKM